MQCRRAENDVERPVGKGKRPFLVAHHAKRLASFAAVEILTLVATEHSLAGIQLHELAYAAHASLALQGVLGAYGPVQMSRSRTNFESERKSTLQSYIIQSISQPHGNFVINVV